MPKNPNRVAAGKKAWAKKSASEKSRILNKLKPGKKAAIPKKVRKMAKGKSSPRRAKKTVPLAIKVGAIGTGAKIALSPSPAYGNKSALGYLMAYPTKPGLEGALKIAQAEIMKLDSYYPAAAGIAVHWGAKKLKINSDLPEGWKV